MRIAPLVLAASLFVPVFFPVLARADARPDPARDPDVARLLSAKHSLKWNVVPPGRSERYGHAEVLVEASADKVRAAAVDFRHYRQLHPKFSSARVIGKDGQDVDVYMKLPVHVGPVNIDQWQVMRFGPPRHAGDVDVIEGHSIKGNVKQGHLLITIRPVDARFTLLKVDLLLVPGMPAPQGAVDEELRDSALQLADALHDKAQGDAHTVTSL